MTWGSEFCSWFDLMLKAPPESTQPAIVGVYIIVRRPHSFEYKKFKDQDHKWLSQWSWIGITLLTTVNIIDFHLNTSRYDWKIHHVWPQLNTNLKRRINICMIFHHKQYCRDNWNLEAVYDLNLLESLLLEVLDTACWENMLLSCLQSIWNMFQQM